MLQTRALADPFSRLAGDLAAALDPVIFAQRIGIDPDPWQADVLRSRERQVLLNCSRQSGKSTTTAVLGLHTAIYQPNSMIILLAPAGRQSKELLGKMRDIYGQIAEDIDTETDNQVELEFGNGSRIVMIPAKQGNIRGFSGVNLLIIDESAFVVDEVYQAVRPFLAVSQGRLMALSTPHGKRGWWSDAWHNRPRWKKVRITAHDCPRLTAEYLDAEKAEIGEWWFRQEYLCEFMDAATQMFTTAEIESAFAVRYETWSL